MKSSLDPASVDPYPPPAEAIAVIVTADQREFRRPRSFSPGQNYLIRVGI
jgi:hypothetical protein